VPRDFAEPERIFEIESRTDLVQPLEEGELLPRYPSVTRDISVLVDDTLPAATARATVREAAPPTLVRVREFDRYQGKGVPEGKVSLSLRLTFPSRNEKTCAYLRTAYRRRSLLFNQTATCLYQWRS